MNTSSSMSLIFCITVDIVEAEKRREGERDWAVTVTNYEVVLLRREREREAEEEDTRKNGGRVLFLGA